MRIQGAVIREQGQTFAVVIVKKHVLDDPFEAERAIASYQRLFPGMPLVLMAQDQNGRPSYRGRPDIAKFLASIHISRIPWKEYTFS